MPGLPHTTIDWLFTPFICLRRFSWYVARFDLFSIWLFLLIDYITISLMLHYWLLRFICRWLIMLPRWWPLRHYGAITPAPLRCAIFCFHLLFSPRLITDYFSISYAILFIFIYLIFLFYISLSLNIIFIRYAFAFGLRYTAFASFWGYYYALISTPFFIFMIFRFFFFCWWCMLYFSCRHFDADNIYCYICYCAIFRATQLQPLTAL